MSEKAISVGDLVMVVKPGSCCTNHLGSIFIVTRIGVSATGKWRCRACGATGPHSTSEPCAFGFAGNPARHFSLYRLKRIPPYEQLEHFRTEESLRRDVKEKA